MITIKIKKQEIQKVKNELKDNFLKNYKIKIINNEAYLAIKESQKKYPEVNMKLEKINIPLNFKEELKKINPKLKSAYDTIGTIAILEIDNENLKQKKEIGKLLLKTNKKVKTVVRKASEHEGTFRLQKYEHLAGKKTLTTIHKENNIQLKIKIDETYFSPRLSTERERINQLIKPNESILVMFSGCGVYPINISKNTKAKEIVGIEINPKAHKLAQSNLKLNKCNNVKLFCGDVKNIIPKLNQKFDRILMPAPKDAEDYLYLINQVSKEKSYVHLYFFSELETLNEKRKNIEKQFHLTHLKTTKCGQQSPRFFRVCFDLKNSY